MRRFAQRHGFEDYEGLQRWSVTDLEAFWTAVADFYGLELNAERVLGAREMPGAQWFPGATLNYAEHMLHDSDDVAVIARSQSREPFEWTFRELRERVAGARSELQRLGVGRGDRVVAYLPNLPETLVGFLATASLGAIWASVSPEFGPRSVTDRFAQVEPKVLVAVDAYTHRGKPIDRREEVAAIGAGLPTLEHTIAPEWPAGGELAFEPVPFDHPLYVLFSSGTTGLPKPIVHGHGGILLEHHKNMGMTWDIEAGDRLLQPTTTAWMMWNALVSALLLRASIVMFDGDVAWPELGGLWELAEETEATIVGVSPAYLMACRKAGVQIPRGRIQALATAGSPLPGEGYDYVYEQLGPDVLLINGSGGTDVCSAIVSGCPMLPVYRGEIAGRCLGVDTAAYDVDGNEIVGELGELVIKQPMPSMPVKFWNDPGDERYRSSYFDILPGRLAPGRLVPVLRPGHLHNHRPLRRDAQPRRCPDGHQRAVRGRRGVRGGGGQPDRAPRGRPGRARRARAVRGRRPRRRSAGADRGRAAQRALPAPRPGHDLGRARDPAHADREEAGSSGQADPAWCGCGYGRQSRRVVGAPRHRCFRAVQ